MRIPLLLSLLLLTSPAYAQETGPADSLPGRVIVRVSSGLERAEVDQIARSVGAEVDHQLTSWDLYLFRFDESLPVSDVVSKLQSRPDVQYAEPDLRIEVNGLSGGDESAGTLPGGGSRIIVAVIDTGIDFSHPSFSGQLYSNPGEIAGDGIDNDGNGYVDDDRGWDFYGGDNNPSGSSGSGAHGTQTAGRVLQGATDGLVSILPLRVGPGPSLSLSAIIEAIDYAARMGARIISMSFGTTSSVRSLQDAIKQAADRQVLLVASAGNGGNTQKNYPAAYSQVVSVAATNAAGQKTSWSTYGNTVDFSAPGENVTTTTWGGGTASVSGTSFSAPFVAGVLARILSASPGLTPKKALEKLRSFAKDIDALNSKSLSGKLGDGFVDEQVAQNVADALPLSEELLSSAQLDQARQDADQSAQTLAAAQQQLDAVQTRVRVLGALSTQLDQQAKQAWRAFLSATRRSEILEALDRLFKILSEQKEVQARLRVAQAQEREALHQKDQAALGLVAAQQRAALLTARAVQPPQQKVSAQQAQVQQWVLQMTGIFDLLRRDSLPGVEEIPEVLLDDGSPVGFEDR